jgi:hypothetical protein
MASDVSACNGLTEEDPANLPGDPFFQDFSSLLIGNPTQLNYGVAVTDIDDDGAFEFVVAGYGTANQAYKYNAATGQFDDVAIGKPALQDSSKKAIGVAACDVDGDGYEELYVLNTDAYSGSTPMTSDLLVDRDASGQYADLFLEAQNQNSANYVAGRSCACLDRTGTGRYGVVVANYGGPMRLFEMPSGGRAIVDKASDVNMAKTTGGRALVAGPLVTNKMDVFANNEGWNGRRLNEVAGTAMSGEHSNDPDLNVTSSTSRRLSHRMNFLFASSGDGSFDDLASAAGLLDASNTGRGTALFDANGDGLIDIVYGNWMGTHRLYVQTQDADGCRRFVDEAPSAMSISSRIRTVIVADFDNDGYEEIFWNNIPGNNRLFRKLPTDSDWVQINIGDALETAGYGTGGAVGDFDGDGVLELVISHGESSAQPLTYFRPRSGQGNHWIRILPLTAFGAPARGAVVTMRAGGRTQLRVIDAGSGYLCQMEPVAHFGLGQIQTVEGVTVTWPDGAAHSLGSLPVDQLHRRSRPSNLQAPAFSGRCGQRSAFDVIPGALSPSVVTPPTGSPTPSSSTSTSGGSSATSGSPSPSAGSSTSSSAGSSGTSSGSGAGTSSGTSSPGNLEDHAVIMGSMTVNNVDYNALSSDQALKAAFESRCKTSIASASGTSAANVQVTLSRGSVAVAYSITVPPSSASTVSASLSDAISTTLSTNVVQALSTIPGINSVVSGSMSVSNMSPVSVTEATNGCSPMGRGVPLLFVVVALMIRM